MKFYLLIGIVTPLFILSQNLGINTSSPTAKLDIVSKGNSELTTALRINDSFGNSVMNVADNGNLSFNKTLRANSNSGDTNYVLSSQGDNKSPQWVNIKETSLGRWVLVAYNGYQNTSLLSDFAANTNVRINMHAARLNSAPIGSWNTTTSEYTVAKAGVYEVTVNIKIAANSDNYDRLSTLFLQIGNYRQGSKGRKIFNDNKNIHLTTKASRYLAVGEKIYAYINSNFDGKFTEATININYSEKIQ